MVKVKVYTHAKREGDLCNHPPFSFRQPFNQTLEISRLTQAKFLQGAWRIRF